MLAEASFDLAERFASYRVVVEDKYGFKNVPPPRRNVRILPEEPPTVSLLRDTFGIGADFDVEGMPVPLGGKIRVPYTCFGPYGLGKAQILYRVLKKQESGNEPVEEDRWVRLNLPEYTPDDEAGPFDPKTGVFRNTPYFKAVPFYAAPSFNPETTLGRTVGGGRVFLETNGLTDSKGNRLELKSNDQVEYCIKVYAAHRDRGETPFTVSETRVTTILSERDYFAWLTNLTEEDRRVKDLEAKQKGIFSPAP
jgi:hypothetical protein